MTGFCSSAPEAAGLASSMVSYIDCQAEQLGSGAWQALAQPGSTLSIVLTASLTLFIAVMGYRMMLGESMNVRSGTLALVRVAIVLALATSWPVYRTLVYDVVTSGPSELAGEISPSAKSTEGGTLLQRIDRADQGLVRLTLLGAGPPAVGDVAPQVMASPFAGFSDLALGGARLVFLIGAIGALAAVRIVAAFMLALGPFFIAFLLFDNSRSLFEGWVRVIGGVFLAALGTIVVLGLELMLLEPWLAAAITRREALQPLPGMPVELLVISTIFALVLLATLIASGRAARAFRLAPLSRMLGRETTKSPAFTLPNARSDTPTGERHRSGNLVERVVVSEQIRGSRLALTGGSDAAARPGGDVWSPTPESEWQQRTPLGRTHQRRVLRRSSASAARRDRKS